MARTLPPATYRPRPRWLRRVALANLLLFTWSAVLATPLNAFAQVARTPKLKVLGPLPQQYTNSKRLRPSHKSFAPASPLKPTPPSLSLLDEVGKLNRPVSDKEVAGWRNELRAHPASLRAARLHLWVGEWELGKNEQPDRALSHFAHVQHLTPRSSELHGLAAYESIIATFYQGAYAQAAHAFRALLLPQNALRGYDGQRCSLWARHATLCAGYHEERARLGIPEPPRLDPLCGVASLATCLRELHQPFDKPHVLAATHVTGRGSSLQDVVDVAKKLGVAAHAVSADDAGLMALPKPLVAYVEHDHFVALVRADKQGVSYLCADCGPWPGGRVDLTWKQWHKMEATAFAVITPKGGLWDQALTTLAANKDNKAIGVQVAASGRLADLHLQTITQQATLAARLAGHVVTFSGWLGTILCGYGPGALHCPPPLFCCATDGGGAGGSGPSAPDPVNLATGEEEYTPAPDLMVHNPYGAPVTFTRLYNSLRGKEDNYDFNDLGYGWSHNYNYLVVDADYTSSSTDASLHNKKLVLPNGATIGFRAPNNFVLPSTGQVLTPSSQTYTDQHDFYTLCTPQDSAGTTSMPFRIYAHFVTLKTVKNMVTTYSWSIAGYSLVDASGAEWEFDIQRAVGSPAVNRYYPSRIRGVQFDPNSLLPRCLVFSYTPSQTGFPMLLQSVGSGHENHYTNSDGSWYWTTTIDFPLLSIDRTSAGFITAVHDWLNRAVYYTVADQPNYNVPSINAQGQATGLLQSQPELMAVSFLTAPYVHNPVTVPSPQYQYGYYWQDVNGFHGYYNGHTGATDAQHTTHFDSNFPGQERIPLLHNITVPSPDQQGMASATIDYDDRGGKCYVYGLTDAEGNKRFYTAPASNITTVSVFNSQSVKAAAYTVAFNANMTTSSMYDGTYVFGQNSTARVSYGYTDSMNPLRVTDVTDGNGNTSRYNYIYAGNGALSSVTTPLFSKPETGATPELQSLVGPNTWGQTNYSYTGSASVGKQPTRVQTGSKAPVYARYRACVNPANYYGDGTAGDKIDRGETSTPDKVQTSLPGTLGGNTSNPSLVSPSTNAGGWEGALAIGTERAEFTFTGFETYVPTSSQLNVGGVGSTRKTFLDYSNLDFPNVPTQVWDQINSYNSPANPNGYVHSVTNNLQWSSDGTGGSYTTKDATGKVTYAYFNAAGQVYQVNDPYDSLSYQQFTQITYQYLGGPVAYVDRGWYDGTNTHIEQRVFPVLGKEGEYRGVTGDTFASNIVYDAAYRVIRVDDGNQHYTSYTYVPSTGYLSFITYQDNSFTQFTNYDPNGNCTRLVTPNGEAVTYTYNALNQVKTVSYATDSYRNQQFVYDNYGRMVGNTDAFGSRLYYYNDDDSLEHVATTYKNVLTNPVSVLPTHTVSYTYNVDATRHSMVVDGNATFTYGYADYNTNYGRLTSLTNPSGQTFTFTYYNNDWLASQQLATQALTTYTYNALGELAHLKTTQPNSPFATLSEFGGNGTASIPYSAEGDPLSLSAAFFDNAHAPVSDIAGRPLSGYTNYTYDIVAGTGNTRTASHLVQENSTRQGGAFNASFAYDAAGNVTTYGPTGFAYNILNELFGPAYDADGNPAANSSGTAQTYNTDDQLVHLGAPYPNSVLDAGYDAFGRRAWKRSGNAGTTTFFLYDEQSGNVVAEMDGSGSVTSTNTFGPKGLLARHIGIFDRFYTFDPFGNTAQVLDYYGTVLTSAGFGSYGALTQSAAFSTSPSAISNDPYVSYGGQWGNYRDFESGYTLMGARYYDPLRGRFVTRDPIGQAGGTNLYTYAGGNPLKYADPSGLSEWSMFGGAAYGLAWGVGAFVLGASNPIGWGVGAAFVGGAALSYFGENSDLSFAVADGFGAATIVYHLQDFVGPAGRLLSRFGGSGPAGSGALSCPGPVCFPADTLVATASDASLCDHPVNPQPVTKQTGNSSEVNKTTGKKESQTETLKYTAIGSLHIGDVVASRNEQTGVTEYKRIVAVTKKTAKSLVNLHLADAATGKEVQTLQATPNHPFYVVGRGWTPAGQLALGNSIVTRAGPALVVTGVQTQTCEQGYVVYNLTVANDHTFFVGAANGGVWVHNSGNCDQPQLPGLEDPPRVVPEGGPKEVYDRESHYGYTPTAAQIASVPKGMSFDHDPPLVQHYYEGDGKGGLPGYQMTQAERMAYARSLSSGKAATQAEQDAQGGVFSHYSVRMRKKFFGF